MNNPWAAIAALVLVATLGAVLARPVIGAADDPPTTSRGEPTAQPSPTAEGPGASPGPAPLEVVGRYPRACLTGVEGPGEGFVAGYDGGGVAVAAPTGGVTTTFSGRLPLGWSPSGDYLATGGGRLRTPDGEPAGFLFEDAAEPLAWSPLADCALGIRAGELLLGRPGADERVLARGDLRALAIAGDGRWAALVVGTDDALELWSLDLASGRPSLLTGFPAEVENVVPGGWAPDGRLLFWALSDPVGADAVPLEAIDETGEVTSLRASTLVIPEVITRCGDRLLAVVGTQTGRGRLRIAELNSSGGPPTMLTEPGFSHFSPTCSHDLQFVGAIRWPGAEVNERRLALLEPDGSFQLDLTDGELVDDSAEWGPEGTGLLFLRRPSTGDNAAQVWYLPEGASPVYSGLETDIPDFFIEGALDWSATPPDGVPD